MLTVYTSTFCRPDYVQLLAFALQRTLTEPYRFVVYVHPEGLVRDWHGVDEIVFGKEEGYGAFSEILESMSGPSVVMHDDMIPVLPWSQASFPHTDVIRFGGHTLRYHANGLSDPVPMLRATRAWQPSDCPPEWPQYLRDAAGAARAEIMLGGIFLHIDKGTLYHPSSLLNAAKPALVSAICAHLQCELPDPLTDDELAVHPGIRGGVPVDGPPKPKRLVMTKEAGPELSIVQKAKNFAASAARHIAAGAPQASEEEVARRFAICEQCEHFDGKACRQCGCPVVKQKKFLSKLSWANESCPVGKWGPVSG